MPLIDPQAYKNLYAAAQDLGAILEPHRDRQTGPTTAPLFTDFAPPINLQQLLDDKHILLRDIETWRHYNNPRKGIELSSYQTHLQGGSAAFRVIEALERFWNLLKEIEGDDEDTHITNKEQKMRWEEAGFSLTERRKIRTCIQNIIRHTQACGLAEEALAYGVEGSLLPAPQIQDARTADERIQGVASIAQMHFELRNAAFL